ncbi:AbrB/MazE/SpoVT family DNA-binding domain-containing protein [bacterium]|nr:AbrB/MazE/SpoVT family DNA-binding domain-containing protein [bacterium]
MAKVTVSPKYQVVIPREMREELDIRPGQLIEVLQIGDRFEFIPVRPIQELRGFLKGMDTSVEREEEDRQL